MLDSVSTTQLAENLMITVASLRRAVRRKLRGQVPFAPMRAAQVDLLRTVEKEPGIGVAAAARAMHLAGNSVSTLVNQLVDAEMLERHVDPADRRAARLHLTKAAEKRLETWRRTRTDYVAGALAKLSKKDIDAIGGALPALGRLLEVL